MSDTKMEKAVELLIGATGWNCGIGRPEEDLIAYAAEMIVDLKKEIAFRDLAEAGFGKQAAILRSL